MILTDPDIRPAYARRLRVPQLELFLEQAIRAVKLRGDVSVLLTGDKQIRRWNREFRGKNKPTDVLSFPAAPLDGPDGPIPAPIAGDLAISVETAARQAAEQRHALVEELKVLLLHGTLHLAGYDHETDNGEMARLEQRLRAKLGLQSSLIERTHNASPKRPLSVRSAAKRPAKKASSKPAKKMPAKKSAVAATRKTATEGYGLEPVRKAAAKRAGALAPEVSRPAKRSR
uniref:Endoribonuclease YbeY n=1 Tax=Acidobacterium capsulatum TaxID=33075 RepID=A0A7V5CTA1_9BACT